MPGSANRAAIAQIYGTKGLGVRSSSSRCPPPNLSDLPSFRRFEQAPKDLRFRAGSRATFMKNPKHSKFIFLFHKGCPAACPEAQILRRLLKSTELRSSEFGHPQVGLLLQIPRIFPLAVLEREDVTLMHVNFLPLSVNGHGLSCHIG